MTTLSLELGYMACGFGLGCLVWFLCRAVHYLLRTMSIGLGSVD